MARHKEDSTGLPGGREMAAYLQDIILSGKRIEDNMPAIPHTVNQRTVKTELIFPLRESITQEEVVIEESFMFSFLKNSKTVRAIVSDNVDLGEMTDNFFQYRHIYANLRAERGASKEARIVRNVTFSQLAPYAQSKFAKIKQILREEGLNSSWIALLQHERDYWHRVAVITGKT